MSRISVKIAADTSELVRLQTEAKRFSARFKQAFEFTSGVAAFGGIAASIAKLKEGFEASVKTGIDFNAKMQDAQVGIAAVFRQFNPAQIGTMEKAFATAGDAVDLLREKAKKSPATFQELVGSFQGVSGAASAAGIGMKKQIDLVVLMSQTLAGLGIESAQILQESRALLTGNITEDAQAARILGITKAQIDSAKAEGKLYEFLTSKMSSFSEAAEMSAQGYTTSLSNMQDVTEQLFAELTEPIFKTLTEDIRQMTATLDSADFKSAIRPFYEITGKTVAVMGELAKWTLKHSEAISGITRAIGRLGIAYGGLKIADYLTGIGREIAARQSSVSVLASETAAIDANTAAKIRNAAAGKLTSAGVADYRLLRNQGITAASALATARENDAARAARAQPISGTGMTGTWKQAVGLPHVLAGMAGWEIGKMIRPMLYGYSTGEDISKAEDYQKRWNGRASAFYEQQNAVTSILEKEKLLADLTEARAEVERDLAENTAPIITSELNSQLHDLDEMAARAERISGAMMERNGKRLQSDAAKEQKTSEFNRNALNYEQGRKEMESSSPEGQMSTLQRDIAKLRNGRSDTELRAQYENLQRQVVATQKLTVDETALGKAKEATRQAEARLSAERAKGFTSRMNADYSISVIPVGYLADAEAAVAAAKKHEAALQDVYDAQRKANEAALMGSKAEAEAIRKTISDLKAKEEQLRQIKDTQEEVAKGGRRISESVEMQLADATGKGEEAVKIQQQQQREDLIEQIRKQNAQLSARGLPQLNEKEIVARYDNAKAEERMKALERARDEMSIREREATGDFAGARDLRRYVENQEYGDSLRRQGFDKDSVNELVSRRESMQTADDQKNLRRFNLEQRALELRGQGREEDAQAIDFMMKRNDESERIQRDFGLDPRTARSLAERRLGAEMAAQQPATAVSSLQRIGGGGGVGGGPRRQEELLRGIHTRLDKLITVISRTDPTIASQVGNF